MPRWYVKPNRSEYLYNYLKTIREKRLQEWRRCFRKPFWPAFYLERKKPLTNSRNSKYDAGQESRCRTPESCYVHEREVQKFEMFKNIVDSRRDGGRRVFQRKSTSGAQGRKTWRKEKLVWRQWHQTQGNSHKPQWNRPLSDPTRQKHRRLAERTGYYSNWYIISGYGISCFLCAHYDVTPPKILSKCGGCVTSVDIHHILICSKGGLIITHHNKVRSELLYLAQLPLLSASVHSKPLIHQGRIISEGGIRQGSEILDTRGEVLIWRLCSRHTGAIIDIKLVNDDTDT